MATVQEWLLENRLDDQGSDINLMKIVSEATWKDILVELVRKEKLDPWNIDIVDVVDKYIEAVKEMKILDLRVPANIILAASVLLRLKSEMLQLEEVIEEQVDGEGAIVRPHVEVGQLELRLRVPPKRRITLQELITALDEAIKLKEVKETMQIQAPLELPIKFDEIDIEQEAENLYHNISAYVDKSRMITFSNLVGISQTDDVLLQVFIPLLFLASKGKVNLLQEKFFDEIIIALAG